MRFNTPQEEQPVRITKYVLNVQSLPPPFYWHPPQHLPREAYHPRQRPPPPVQFNHLQMLSQGKR